MKPMECSRLNAKNRVQAGEENFVDSSVKGGRKVSESSNKKRIEMLSLSSSKNCSAILLNQGVYMDNASVLITLHQNREKN